MDLETGEIFGFGASMFPAGFNVFKLDTKHQLKQKTLVPIKKPIYAHDFAITKNFIVLIVCLIRMHIIEGIAGIHSFSEAIRFEKNLPTEVVILSKNDLSVVSRFESVPFFFWHCGNAYERKNQNGSVEICFEAVTYDDFDSNIWLGSLISKNIKSDTKGSLTLRVINVNQKSMRVEGNIGNVPGKIEFPKVQTSAFGIQPSKLACVFRPEGDPMGGLWRGLAAATSNGKTETYLHNNHTYYSEPEIIVNESKEFILSIALNALEKTSEVHLFEGPLSNGPTCIFALDSAVSPGFHGSWRAD